MMTHTANPLARLVSLILSTSLLLPGQSFWLLRATQNNNGQHNGQVRRTLTPPLSNLPNLDEVRQLKPGPLKAKDPVPSTKCSDHDGPCKLQKEVIEPKLKGKTGNNYLPGSNHRGIEVASFNPPALPARSNGNEWLDAGALLNDYLFRDSGQLFSGLVPAGYAGAAEAPVAPYGGNFDYADCSFLYGWAWDAAQPNTPISVDVFADNNYVATGMANLFRQDLVNAGIGNGYHGFTIPLPTALRDGLAHSLVIVPSGTGVWLGTCPRTLNCPSITGLSAARLDPVNRTGTGGEDLYSGNYNWTLPLIGLPGRAGLDLGLSLSYNSLVWTKTGSSIVFDADRSPVTPGFTLGYPVIEPAFYDSTTGSNTWLMTTSSGGHVSLRQTPNSTTVFESFDSSYLQLVVNNAGNFMTLKTPDGTQMKYEWVASAWRCTAVEDRNGNFLTVTYTYFGRVSKITDTLGREVEVTWDSYNHPLSVVNKAGGIPFTWWTFGYTTKTIQTSFSGLTVYGPANNASIPVLAWVSKADYSRYEFEYNSYGQVKTIHTYGDTLEQSRVSYTFADTGALADCPRFTARNDYANEWMGPGGATTTFDLTPGRSWNSLTPPDGTLHKELFATTGWQRGLSTGTETWSGGVKQRWTTTAWDQDNTGVSYYVNPRVIESNVYDGANRRRTTVSYTSFNLLQPNGQTTGTVCNLPKDTVEYQADATTVYRTSRATYNTDSEYIKRRIIGLPAYRYLYAGVAPTSGEGSPVSKVGFNYDEATYGTDSLLQDTKYNGASVTPTGHDTSIYGYQQNFRVGRGNLTSATRYDVTGQTPNSVTRTGYNITGSPVIAWDAGDRKTSISYVDAWYDNLNRNTFAYPTVVTDPDGYSSSISYYLNLGTVQRTQDPKMRAAGTNGILYTYDALGRTERVRNEISGAYTRYYYAPSHYYMQSWTKTLVGQDDNPDYETYTTRVFDGHGRLRATATDHPGSVGGHRSKYNGYDNMGRLVIWSNPTEINSGWGPAGDDVYVPETPTEPAHGGYVWSSQAYDWKGRPTVMTNQDGTLESLSYEGCGCAGGNVITSTDEGGRKQKIYHDVLGRQTKTRTLNPDESVYSTTTNTYDVSDQMTSVKEYQGQEATDGTCPAGTCQEAWTIYDGHGRVYQSKQVKETGPRTYTYSGDGRLYTMTDARGVTTTYAWYGRQLLKDLTYSGGGNVKPSNPVHYDYDAAGNRTRMTDGLGQVDYVYDTLSRMTSETRTFSNLASYNSSNFISYNNVISVYTLGYEYNLAGELTKITDPWQGSVSYQRDKVGRVASMTASGYGNYSTYNGTPINNTPITNIVSGVKYRAWDALRQFDTGTVASLAHFDYTYNPRQLLTRLDQGGRVTSHTYYDDGRLKDVTNSTRATFNLHYEYDHVGRLRLAKAGNDPDWTKNPYFFIYKYNAFGDTTKRTGDLNETPPGTTPGHYWSQSLPDFEATWTNHKDNSLQYDEIGNLGDRSNYNQAGNEATRWETYGVGSSLFFRFHYDGDGRRAYDNSNYGSVGFPDTPDGSFRNSYLLKSTPLGGTIVATFDLLKDAQNRFWQTYTVGLFFEGGRIAEYSYGATAQTSPASGVTWIYDNPVTGGRYGHSYASISAGAPPTGSSAW